MRATVFCDGACSGNPGPGGWAAIIRVPGRPDIEITGGRPQTTNNIMELAAAYSGIAAAKKLGATAIEAISDSEYLTRGMTEWLPVWQRNNWRTSKRQPVANRQAWEALLTLCDGLTVKWTHVDGHSGHTENERCDLLARGAIPR